MAKYINLGNGTVLIGLDSWGQVKDLYFHYAGLENHISEKLVHKIGLWINGALTWIDDGSWSVSIDYEKETMASSILAENQKAGIKIYFSDVLYNEMNIFIRQITVENLFDMRRDIKIFFNQQFNISQTHIGDTGYYDPLAKAIVHYKGRRVFLINAMCDNNNFSEYSIGLIGIEGKTGTYKDAEDGVLTMNPIENGQVDSVIAVNLDLPPKDKKTLFYWMTIGKSIKRVRYLNKVVLERKPGDIIKTTKDYWNAWVNNQKFSFYGLSEEMIKLFKKSLIIIRTHVNNNGSIIASGDSDMLQYGRDTYSYVWPRDGAFSALALAKAGDFNASHRFFEFCSKIISDDGYFMHKYRPDKSLGSSWHPWVRNGQVQIPIQEDETALVINSLWTHFELSKDLEFIEGIYNRLVKSPAEFMVNYRDKKTGLPKPSYDIWEEKYGISTFTSSTVYQALVVAGKFAKLLGKEKSATKYYQAAESIKEGIIKYLYDPNESIFYKLINIEDGNIIPDKTIDFSSIYGIYKFKVLDLGDSRLSSAFAKFVDRLSVKTPVAGIARREADQYHSFGGNVPGNPWIITTLWRTQYRIDNLKNESELADIVKDFAWVVDKALPSGILPEQMNPYTGEHVSAAPLIWSHAEYVRTIVQYLEKLEELGISKVINKEE